MIILKILKWVSYFFTGVVILLGFLCFTFSHFDKSPPINYISKTCLITGASSGIGKHLAIEMIKRGWKVIGIARHEDKLKEVEKELGAVFIPYVCDVSKPDQVHLVSEQIKQQQLNPTLFFLNAGTGFGLKFIGIWADKFQPIFNANKQTFDTNYFGVIAWIDEWLNDIKSFGGGTFVAISSINAIFAGPGSAGSGYGASKAAISSIFRSLRLRYYNDNVGFVDVLPGPVATQALADGASNQPFVHQPEDEARYIIEQVFNRKRHIEPSWYYYFKIRQLSWLPDKFLAS